MLRKPIISKTNIVTKGGAELATRYKLILPKLRNVSVATNTYNSIFNKLQVLYYDTIGEVNDNNPEAGVNAVFRIQVQNFFDIMDKNDVLGELWRMDNQKTLFKDMTYEQVYQVFPYVIRFFNLFYDKNMKIMNNNIQKLIDSGDHKTYIYNNMMETNTYSDNVFKIKLVYRSMIDPVKQAKRMTSRWIRKMWNLQLNKKEEEDKNG